MRLGAALIVIGLLSGCTVPAAVQAPVSGAPTLGIFEAATLINTDKTLGDHIFSFTSGKDCSTLRSQNEGGDYCITPEVYQPPEPVPTYCYASLGGTNCYTQPLQGANDRFLGTSVN